MYVFESDKSVCLLDRRLLGEHTDLLFVYKIYYKEQIELCGNG